MREIIITDECLNFVDDQDQRFIDKFFQLVEVMSEVKVIHSNFVKRLISTKFYELRLKVRNEYRIIMFAIDCDSFIESRRVICLNGFQKKSTKDYKRQAG